MEVLFFYFGVTKPVLSQVLDGIRKSWIPGAEMILISEFAEHYMYSTKAYLCVGLYYVNFIEVKF